MPQALPQGQGSRVFAGVRAIFAYNGTPVAFASGISGSEEYGYEGIEVLNQIKVVEHVPLSYRATLSCSVFRTLSRRPDPKSAGAPGSLKEQAIFPRLNQILRLEGVDVAVYDEISKKAVYFFEKVKAASRNFNIGARAVVLENVNFVTTACFDEADPETQALAIPATP